MQSNQLVPERQDFSDIKHNPWAFETLSKLYGEELAAQQLNLEHEAYELGEAQFLKTLDRSIKQGEYADSR